MLFRSGLRRGRTRQRLAQIGRHFRFRFLSRGRDRKCHSVAGVGASILAQADRIGKVDAGRRNLGVALMLGIAYAASIGGMATPIGTPPNVIFMGIYRENTDARSAFSRG